MNKWSTRLQEQKNQWVANARSSDPSKAAGTSSTEFTYIQNQGHLENPYRQPDDEEDEDGNTVMSPGSGSSYPSMSEYNSSWNQSQTSIRSRSTTGDSGPPPMSSAGPTGRMLPPRFPPGTIPMPGLSVRTQQLAAVSPADRFADRFADSYFSPSGADSPAPSSRASASSGMYPFPRQPMPKSGYHENGQERYTAPIMPYRTASREALNGQTSYPQSARVPGARPPFGGNTNNTQASQQAQPVRNRSVSSPSINEAQRRAMNSNRPPMPDMPASMHPDAHTPYPTLRSQSNSPHLSNGIDSRIGATSPKLMRDRSESRSNQGAPPQTGYDGARTDPRFAPTSGPRTITPIPYGGREQAMSPPLSTPLTPPDMQQPTQLKVKVHATQAGQTLTLVVPLNITFQSLKDRIDAKLMRSTNFSLTDRGSNQVKLKYLDDDDYVSIQSDEDVQIAFETWREQRGDVLGGMGEIELFCQ